MLSHSDPLTAAAIAAFAAGDWSAARARFEEIVADARHHGERRKEKRQRKSKPVTLQQQAQRV